MSEFYSTSFKDKKVILRLDLNTPLYLKNSLVSIADDSRIIASLPTIKKLVNDGAKILIISQKKKKTHLQRALPLINDTYF